MHSAQPVTFALAPCPTPGTFKKFNLKTKERGASTNHSICGNMTRAGDKVRSNKGNHAKLDSKEDNTDRGKSCIWHCVEASAIGPGSPS